MALAHDELVDAVGPETLTYRELVRLIAGALGLKRLIIGVPSALGYWSCRTVGWLKRDVVITREEIAGLMLGLLCVESPPLGKTRLSDWVLDHKQSLGRRFHE
jgi:hypothetical protein